MQLHIQLEKIPLFPQIQHNPHFLQIQDGTLPKKAKRIHMEHQNLSENKSLKGDISLNLIPNNKQKKTILPES